MSHLKVNILFDLHDGPMGGGNQFLKALKDYFRTESLYVEDPVKADMILFNGHQFTDRAASLRFKYRNKSFVHRIDGPSKIYNRKSDTRDCIVDLGNKYLADATIFQSVWSRQENHRLGCSKGIIDTVIHNAPDQTIFNTIGKTTFSPNRKTRLIATSWSGNRNKGFDVYKWLDDNLNFDKYEMTFLGNSPVKFHNIKHIPPLATNEVAERLKQNDIFIFASIFEACSNSLLEALHCRLPVIVINSSSNPELLGKGGETFDKPEEIPALLDKVKKNYQEYQARIKVSSIDEIGKRYYDFMSQAYNKIKSDPKTIKPFGIKEYLGLRIGIGYSKINGRILRIFEKQQKMNLL